MKQGGRKKILIVIAVVVSLLLMMMTMLLALAVVAAACPNGSSGDVGDGGGGAAASVDNSSYKAPEHSSDPVAEKIATYMEAAALDDSHGYSQPRRTGNPDYDCSSLVFFAVKSAGIPLPGGPFTTYNEGDVLMPAGFAHLTWSGDWHQAKGQLQRGDIVVNRVEHTEVYVGGGLFAGARHACPGGIDDGAPGDQCKGDNQEIGIGPYLDPGLVDVYRHDPNAHATSSGDTVMPGAAAPAQCAAEPNADGGPAEDGTGASADQAKRIAQGLLPTYFTGADVAREQECLVTIWTHESGWNLNATNPSSGAYGIPQALPGDKMASAGPDWRTNATTQIKWGLQYIKDRYQTPCGAWSEWQRKGWY
jgi:hypothetical protein